jgi:hypothetical protein
MLEEEEEERPHWATASSTVPSPAHAESFHGSAVGTGHMCRYELERVDGGHLGGEEDEVLVGIGQVLGV